MGKLVDHMVDPSRFDFRSQLDQGSTWTSRDGVVRRVDQLTEQHVVRILRMIERVAPALLEDAIDSMMWCDPPDGETAAADLFWSSFEELMMTAPSDYVDDMDVVVALRRRLRLVRR